MTPQELKNSILQLAIQGRLVEQRPEEGTAEELFQQIQVEKAELLKQGKIKKERPLPEIAEEEIPFEIPESWKWVLLNDVVSKTIKRGKSPTYARSSSTLVFAQKCNTKAGVIDMSLALYLEETKLCKYDKEEFMLDEDIVINSTGNGTLGRVGIFRDSDNIRKLAIVPDSHVTVIRAIEGVYSRYIFYCLKYYSPYLEKLGSGSTNQTELSANSLKCLYFPLPPLAEQKRIVAKIEELMPLVDRYEEAWTKLEAFNKRFPEDMQKSLLQMAIQGKLVEQRSEEGTGEELFEQIQAEKQRLIKEGKIKKDKPLPEITDDEKPFDIPESWKWVRISNITYNLGQKKPDCDFCYIDVGSINNKKHCLNDYETVVKPEKASSRARKIVQYGDVIFATIRPYLQNICIINRHFSCEPIVSTAFAVMSCINGLYNKYLFYCVLSPYFMEYTNANDKAKGVAYPAIGEKDFFSGVVPLPPLAEQKRIVAKLEELLPLCERLK